MIVMVPAHILPAMFDGLPLHVLIVHFAVVLLPLCAIALVALAIVRPWRRRYAPIVLLTLAVGVVAAFASKSSGEALAAVMGEPHDHAMYGDIVPWVSAALFLVALVWATTAHAVGKRRDADPTLPQSTAAAVLGFLMIILSIATLVLTFLVGHTGARAAWAGRLPGNVPTATVTPTPSASVSPSASATPSASASDSASTSASETPSASASGATSAASPSASASGYTMAEVAQHNDSTSCWTVINGTVYNLTSWINQHPGGTGPILSLCGTDGTSAFEAQHGGEARPQQELAQFKIGALAG